MDTWHPIPNAKHIVIWDENHDARMINNPRIEVAVSAAEVYREMTPIMERISGALDEFSTGIGLAVTAIFGIDWEEAERTRRREIHLARCARRRERRRKASP